MKPMYMKKKTRENTITNIRSRVKKFMIQGYNNPQVHSWLKVGRMDPCPSVRKYLFSAEMISILILNIIYE